MNHTRRAALGLLGAASLAPHVAAAPRHQYDPEPLQVEAFIGCDDASTQEMAESFLSSTHIATDLPEESHFDDGVFMIGFARERASGEGSP